MKKRFFLLLAAVVLLLGLNGISEATLIGDSVTVYVEASSNWVPGDSYLGSDTASAVVTSGLGYEFEFDSTLNLDDEAIFFDFEDYYVDISITDYTAGDFAWTDGEPTFHVQISSIDIPEFSSGIAGLSVTGDTSGLVYASSFGPTSISLDITDGLTLGPSTDLDFRVNFSAVPVPEPATMLLLGSGLIGLAGLGRKKLFKQG